MKVYERITDLIGHTPLLKLNHLISEKELGATVREPLTRIYSLTAEEADLFFRDMWLVVHSIATLTVSGDCGYGEKEISGILTGFSVAVCKAIKEVPGFVSGTFDRNKVFAELVSEKSDT